MTALKTTLIALGLVFAATFLAGCCLGCGDCSREKVLDCIGTSFAPTPVQFNTNCQNADTSDDSIDCCEWANKVITCHKEKNCDCDQARQYQHAGDGVDTVRDVMRFQRATYASCEIAFADQGWKFDSYCA